MNGLLIVDKPSGPSSHDVVARVRRVLREPRIGHTGTLDPLASGVLPLVVGRATRLARFLSTSTKRYDAVVRLGFSTNTYDAVGRTTGAAFAGVLPSKDVIDAALDRFRGAFMQRPPAYSAKKIDGEPSYKLARRADRSRSEAVDANTEGEPPAGTQPEPVDVTTSAIEILGIEDDRVRLIVECSAGFYVRSLAHDLGEVLGTGAHLHSLRRTRSGDATLDQAVPLDALEDREQGPDRAKTALIPLSHMLPAIGALTLTREGVEHTRNGCELKPSDFTGPMNIVMAAHSVNRPMFRLIDPAGELVALAVESRTPGLLHPSVVLV